MRSSRPVRALVAAALLTTVAACGGSSDEAAPAGDAEDALVLYSGRNEALIGPLLARFTEASGIAVTPRYGDSAALAATLLEEGDRTPAAAFLSQDAGALGALQDADRLTELPDDQLDRVPEAYRSPEGRWVGLSGRSRVLLYDSAVVDEGDLPDSVFDLTDPTYRGTVGIAPTNASFQSFVTGMRVLEGEDRTREFLEGLQANDVQTYENNIAILDAVESGQIPFGLANHYYLYERVAATEGGLEALDARNHFFDGGDPGALVNVAGIGVLEGKDDDRTEQLVEFLLSDESQRYFADDTKEFPLVDGVEAVEDLPTIEDLEGPDVDLSELDSLQETQALLEEVGLT